MTKDKIGVEVFAPAKINLCLHVTGQRSDGYHLLDTLVAFADIGDTVTLSVDGPGGLDVSGPEATPDLAGDGNIMSATAARFWGEEALSMHLDKQLPIASGIGGGSADAAATYRGVLALRAAVEGRDAPRDPTAEDAVALMEIGADVPMCVPSTPARVQGIGEQITPISDLHPYPIVLVNPRVQVSTPTVFKRLARKENPALDRLPRDFEDRDLVLDWLGAQRNDLQAPALEVCPEVGAVLEALGKDQACRLTRMSGSGATCFGLFIRMHEATAAAEAISATHPGWWIRVGRLKGGRRAAPQLIRSTT
ncbi:4-(cytidine 5'-diphospho)-2-C-methyl-D-erythritol kinase [uncultured Tateyamaria sp.]|uniref:4-(cytidine 5'-diphospho)-2-C-methyl-D-erythritol kinase n=1 Tax=uncultured Tateyamaria sp. TaxID=455651 RepID=UPI002639AB74|nr:4-(cytidine 5'-diphospho)-2-C-methyl-D-erythritol kinase [uncultured Tateyamaria sp.]